MAGDSSKVAFLWQHEHGSKWITYANDEIDFINKAYNKGQKSVTLPDKDPKKKIAMYFDKMFQKNKVSGWEQRIRCCVFDKAFYVWQWQDDEWEYYTPGISVELESSFNQGKNAKFFFNKRDYEVDLKKFKQTNEKTGSERSVRREKVTVDFNKFLKEEIGDTFKAYLEAKCELDTAAENSDEPSVKKMKTLLPQSTGGVAIFVPVDEECTDLQGKVKVFIDESGIYDAVLNQTNLQFNNNKYYRMQLLKEYAREKYYVWFRWGRVGNKGQRNLIPFHHALESAKEEFMKKFHDKTANDWAARENFEKVPGKYDLLKMEYKITKEETEEKPEVALSTEPSKLPEIIVSLLQKISDKEEFVRLVVEMKYDVRKNPLGKLDAVQIRAGWIALQKIEEILKSRGSGCKLVQACSEYYTRIPHNFGMKSPPVISTYSAILEEIKLLQVLSDADVTFRIKNELRLGSGNPIDCLYDDLKCDIKWVDPTSAMYEVIKKYLKNTHGPTHTTYEVEIIHAFECSKQIENEKFEDYGNKYLLWHGSRITNFVGILKHGLQIAPSEAPATGYMFGKGLYFADISTKSANYCYPTRKNNEGLVLLCEVSLGDENVLYSANYDADIDTKRKKKNCVKAKGKIIPDPNETIEHNGVKIPLGEPVTVIDDKQYELNYNEYVIYNRNQVQLKYLVHLGFVFK